MFSVKSNAFPDKMLGHFYEKSQGFVKISRRLVKIILDLFSKKP